MDNAADEFVFDDIFDRVGVAVREGDYANTLAINMKNEKMKKYYR